MSMRRLTANESQGDTLLWLIYESHKLWLAGRKELTPSSLAYLTLTGKTWHQDF